MLYMWPKATQYEYRLTDNLNDKEKITIILICCKIGIEQQI